MCVPCYDLLEALSLLNGAFTVDGAIAMEERKKGGGLGRATICNPTQAFLVSLLLISRSLRTERPEQAILTIARERLNIDI